MLGGELWMGRTEMEFERMAGSRGLSNDRTEWRGDEDEDLAACESPPKIRR